MLSTPKLTRSSAAESTPAAAPPRSLLDPDRSFDLDLDDDDDDDDDDLPPPLEDASAELASKRAEAAHLKHAVRARLEQEKIRKANRKVDATTLLMDRPGAAPVAGESAQAKPKPMTTTGAGGLAGMRRGFLNRSSNSGNKNKAATGNKDVMPSVSVRNSDQAKADPLVFSDVQAALKEAAMGQMDPNLYVTPSLLGSIDSDAHLRAIFDDPGFAEFLAIVEKDPAAAQKKYDPRTNPKAGKYWKGMQRVTGLMGKEIEANASASSRSSSSQADKQQQQPQQKKEVERPKIEELDDDEVPKLMSQPAMSAITPISTRSIKPTPSPPAVTNPSHDDLPAHEHALIERVQGDVRVREALMDPQVQRFLDGMRRGGGGVELGQFMAQASRNPSLMAKVQVLMEVGLLQVQT